MRAIQKPGYAGSAHRTRARRTKRPLPAASAVPHKCVVLAVDTAELSGWCVNAGHDEFLAFGEADTLDGRALRYIVRWAASHAERRGLPLVLVLESPWGGPAWVLIGLGAARERWMSAWRDEGKARCRVVMVQPSEWRARVLGSQWAKAKREVVRPHEQAVAAAMVGQPVRGDEAPAILIARWSMRCAKVARALPAARRKT
jgi:hypothetical protein